MRGGHPTPTSKPAAAAERPTAVVVGGGISGLIAARELASAGSAVTVLEAGTSWGGCVGSHVVAGLRLDSGAESFATRSTAVADLARELGLAERIVAPHPGGAWVQLPDGPQELPKTGVLGIPANPWDPEVRRSLGLAGSIRASLDRWLPASVGTSSEVTSVSSLVRTRMGKRVLKRLVSPVVGGVHSADPALLDVDMVAPGLRAGIRTHGSLAAAVATQRKTAQRPAASGAGAASGPAKAGSAVAGLKGGMNTLVEALVADLRERGVQLLSGRHADAVVKTADGWQVTAGESTFDAGRLVVALDGPAAVGLLEKSLPELSGLRPAPGPLVSLVTMVVDLPQLDGRPRGTGILVAPETPGIRAKALTHATAKWDWLAEQAGPGTHVLRLSYGRREEANAGPDVLMDDDSLLAAAVEDASALLTVPVSRADIVDWDVVRWAGALPFAAVGHKQRVEQVRRACSAADRLTVVGGWLAGNGLAAVVADTRRQLASVREDDSR
ncbi:protoporphyrinogen oxidase [Paenarthrobacter aurescens]|uniref:Coproporphyrinogen III oxidase n=1 Tax=Paenarthrobacter aurescens TaxID=43663 RepID=A0A4Y3NPL2_PAEAU|nr:protoporphyrinogen oxidase [Paenarthrobacter aurescens]MDO6144172.1 protoporphyrinogen oxidase [Paenarthrobacter aurescens]MDO6148019.1 protoporphyrinogen oxidase [Paenarthrobacter aurescens]MDO6159263.1 protoporphyrinogen oxidase [Paenarthrobacter aurescens]MDO6163246.1 protoporphyrinogen oxidase [Paenarthrobacter aurescens]GEB20689.1 protoporphyrinogen oxidase [Paenarthrobacter aurescens]